MTQTPHNPPDLVDAFLSQVQSTGNMAAVDDHGAVVTYEELCSLAYRFAGAIQSVAPEPSPRVLLALPPSTSAYAAMIGSLIGGGTFCPIHLGYPEGRNAAICQAFCPDIIFYERSPPSFLDVMPVTTHRIDVLQLDSYSVDSPAGERSDVAYVVFTSGSTGNPKGVKLGRRGFSYFLDIVRSYFDLRAGERWGQFSNLGHDLGVMDVFMALTQGATLVSLDDAERRFRPATAIRDRRISVWQSVPSVIELMMQANQLTSEYLAPLRVMSFCGDRLHPHQLVALFNERPDLHVFNTYGTTETTGFNTLNHLTSSNYTESCQAGDVSIGDDVPGWRIHLRGGETSNEGEIVVAGEFVSLGYWRDENRTRSVFRQVEFDDSGVQRCYFTGDRAVRQNGRLYCLGRMDRQVKIRGERFELDEIDSLLREAGFNTAYTIFKDDALYSFVESTREIDQDRVRILLTKSLPFHAIPKSIQSLTSLPRNENGKIDREALSRMVSS